MSGCKGVKAASNMMKKTEETHNLDSVKDLEHEEALFGNKLFSQRCLKINE